MKKKMNPSHKSTAQAMVEFALILPVLLLLVYGMLEVGRLLFIYSSVVSAARQASRYGATTGRLPGEIETDPNALRRYNDCAEMRAAAQRVGFIQGFADSDIAIDWDEGEGSPKGTEYEEPKPVVFGSHINDYCPPGGLPTDDSFNAKRDCIGNNCRIRVEVRTQYSPIVPLVPLEPFEIRSVSARTILVSVPIIITSAPLPWDPSASPISPYTETPTITLTPTNMSTAPPIGSATPTLTLMYTNTPVTPTDTGTPTGTSTPVPPPGPFSKISPGDNDTGEPYPSTRLTWGASTNADYYEVCVDQTDDDRCDSNDNWPITVTGTSYDANTTLGTLYSWHVRAVNYENPTIKTYSNDLDTAFWTFTTSTSVSSCFVKGDPLSFVGTSGPLGYFGFSTTIYNKSAFTISISQLKITWNRTPSQKLDALEIGPTTISSLNSNALPHIETISVDISTNGNISIKVWFGESYTKASTDEIVVTFGTSGCAPLVIK